MKLFFTETNKELHAYAYFEIKFKRVLLANEKFEPGGTHSHIAYKPGEHLNHLGY